MEDQIDGAHYQVGGAAKRGIPIIASQFLHNERDMCFIVQYDEAGKRSVRLEWFDARARRWNAVKLLPEALFAHELWADRLGYPDSL